MTKNFKIQSKRSFTLLEILLTITILSMVGAYFALHSKNLFTTYGFRREAQALQEQIMLARELSRSYQADVEVVLSFTKKGYVVVLISDEPALKRLKTFNKPSAFPHIKKMYFSDETISSQATLLFSGTGWVFPEGKIYVFSEDGQKIAFEVKA